MERITANEQSGLIDTLSRMRERWLRFRCASITFSAGIFWLSCLGGCATPQTQALLNSHAGTLPQQVELSAVPFYQQESHQCGPVSLAMVLNANGVRVTPQQLQSQLYLPGRKGSLQVEMLAATRRNGLLAYELAPQLDDLLTEVANGYPVIVLQNLALSWYPMWHYSVVVGYDIKREEIILRSGVEQRQVLPLTTFEHTWARSEHWAMLALPPGQMPRTAIETAYVAAAIEFENVAPPRDAEAVYAAALKRWPHNLAARIGEGNSAYSLGDKQRAENAFRQATLDHPDSPIAFNNLAQTLADQKRYLEALDSANQAVGLGGSEQAVARDTLQQIKKEMQQ